MTLYSEIRPLVFLDSGLGGLPYVETFRKLKADSGIVYVADTKNFPYGSKPEEEVKTIVFDLVDKIVQSLSPRLIVIACNTASVISLSELRQRFHIPFVGVVPAVKPAALSSLSKKIGILATERTVRDAYLQKLEDEHASSCIVHRYAATELVDFVEKHWLASSADERSHVVNKFFKIFQHTEIDRLVLGCTHFIFLENEIKSLFTQKFPDFQVIDSRKGVSQQILRLLQSDSFFINNIAELYISELTDIEVKKYRAFSSHFGLTYRGKLC